MTRIKTLTTLLALACLGAAHAADAPATSLATDSGIATGGPSATAEAPAATPEAPYVGDPVVVTAEQRVERSLRTVQIALERTRSDRIEDEDKVVCVKQAATGSHRQVINCATNRFWRAMRDSSLGSLGGVGGGGTARKDEQMFTMTADDYYKLEKRFGTLPESMRDLK